MGKNKKENKAKIATRNMIRCRKCGKAKPLKAKKCPHCGYKTKSYSFLRDTPTLVISFVLILFLLMMKYIPKYFNIFN